MVVARSLTDIHYDKNSVVTIGTFDGVHLGHQTIIREVLTRARARKGRSMIVTFDPHPRDVVGRGPVDRLTTDEERLTLFETLGIDATLVVNFTYEFSRLAPEEFYESYIVHNVGVAEVVEGHDHMFGRDRQAGVESLLRLGKRYGFISITVPPVMIGTEAVSSTAIREMLRAGNVEKAGQFLGRAYSLSGIVVKGDGRGKELGFPTANIQPDVVNKMIPANGVYIVKAQFDHREVFGMLNIGVRPTFRSDQHRTVEVHLLDVAEQLYGKHISIFFLKHVRQERKFSSKEDLIAQLHHDKETSMKYIDALQLS